MLTKNAETVIAKRYAKRDAQGQIVETPDQVFQRVAQAVAGDTEYYEPFYELMRNLEFLPNSPTLMNAGTELGQLSACFVLPVEDDMSSIFTTIHDAALIHQSGGGTGFSFSRLRPRGDYVKSTGGVASGPVSFMKVFDAATNIIKQGGKRRGANIAILSVHHPDIQDFIRCKNTEGDIANFNISVAITDAFMQTVLDDEPHTFVNPRTGEKFHTTLMAQDLFQEIVDGAWHNGEPGVIFIDQINRYNTTPQLGNFEACNPCGETPLLPYEACNLGSINLTTIYEDGEINWSKLERITRLATRFLDMVIDVNHYPLPAIATAVKRTRKIGLGIMGWADLLYLLEKPYALETVGLLEDITAQIQNWATDESINLALEKGVFPAFRDATDQWSCANIDPQIRERALQHGLRNATRTTIAPTGTISIVAGVSSGIEPNFALAIRRREVLDGEEMFSINPILEQTLQTHSLSDYLLYLKEHGELPNHAPAWLTKVYITAHNVSPECHIAMQAAAQVNVDNAVSKTVNLNHDATSADVYDILMHAYDSQLKGVTIYRDGSREVQVLNRPQPTTNQPRKREEILLGQTQKIQLGCGRTLYITLNEDDTSLCEVFLSIGKSGGCLKANTEAIGRVCSLALRAGVDPQALVKTLRGIRCLAPTWRHGGQILSCADAVGQAIEDYLGCDCYSLSGYSPECPECGNILEFTEGCNKCPVCGWSACA